METTETPVTAKVRKTKVVQIPGTETFNWGKREFGIIAKSFEAEPVQVQNTMIAASGMLQIIKLNINESPQVIAYLIKKQYPELSELGVFGLIEMGVAGLPGSEVKGDTLPDLLASLGAEVSALHDVQWNNFWDGMFKSICIPLTQWEKVCAYAPYVYNVLVKPVIK